MAKDPVCGMMVDPAKAAGKSVHTGVEIYFCSVKCKERFDAEPDNKDGRGGAPDADGFEAIPRQGVKAIYRGAVILPGNRRLMESMGIETAFVEERLEALEAKGRMAVIVAGKDSVVGVSGIADIIKEGSVPAIQSLKRDGMEVIMLTGDNERTAKAIAAELGLEKVIAGVLPGEKAGMLQWSGTG